MPTAFVVDGAYFIRRFRSCFPTLDRENADHIVKGLGWMVSMHMRYRTNSAPLVNEPTPDERNISESKELYRIFFYDCPPLQKRLHRPISKTSINMGQTAEAILRNAVHLQLRDLRKCALRLGRLSEFRGWRLTPAAISRWMSDPDNFLPTDDDFEIDISQKGVDMRLGIDVASMAFKKQVDQIVMVAGDADFVPAAKLARREGIDVLVDPMFGDVPTDLEEHADGRRSFKFTFDPEEQI